MPRSWKRLGKISSLWKALCLTMQGSRFLLMVGQAMVTGKGDFSSEKCVSLFHGPIRVHGCKKRPFAPLKTCVTVSIPRTFPFPFLISSDYGPSTQAWEFKCL
eukprot:c17400_g1_i1 orf=304-612(+)